MTSRSSCSLMRILLLVVAGCGATSRIDAADSGAAPASSAIDAGTGDGSSGDAPIAADASGCWQSASVPDVSTMGKAGTSYPAPAVSSACEGSQFVIRSNGIPTFAFVPLTPNGLQAKTYAFKMPAVPAEATTKAPVPLGGPVAVTVTGIPIFGPTENPMDGYRDPVLDDMLQNLLDECNGHTAPGGTYHFHANPTCIVVALGGERHGLVIGWSFDGYPILSPVVCTDAACAATRRVKSSWRRTVTDYTVATRGPAWDIHTFEAGLGDLDRCNGLPITEPGSKFDYAYFATDTFPYFLGCYHGTPTSNR